MASSSMDMGSSSFTPRWDVFLSFRGVDTRNNFTAHLYEALRRSGIQTFKDDPDLRSGEETSSTLLKAIQESKISVLVISENYASSPWCLKELVEILECMHIFHQLVIPVFYKVTPSDVRHQLGSFAEAFEKHELRYGQDQLKMWRDALTKAAGISGHSVDANTNEAELIKKMVEQVRVQVTPVKLHVAKEPVGITPHVHKIKQLLGNGTNGVWKIGIYGMGGVGKSTIAKAVYNEICHSFEGSCFLANVREVWGQPDGIVRLQKRLFSDVLKEELKTDNADNGKSIIEERFRFKKVLIVLDDLDHIQQLPMFLAGAPGSIALITARDENLLDKFEVGEKYKVQELDPYDSSELFCRHAFKEIVPSEGFKEVTQKIVDYANGLPLALEVFGSSLFRQTTLTWERFLEKLQLVPNHDINRKLMISYDTLPEVDLQAMFLDIACFFIGKRKEEVTTILSACYSFAETGISILEQRCLLKFHKKHDLSMHDECTVHDLLRDMGREIVRIESPTEPGKRSRLWNFVDIHNVLRKNKGTGTIEAIILPKSDNQPLRLTVETFKKMDQLRLLDIDKTNLTGNFEDIFEKLRWFRWHHCESLPSGFHPHELVILDLSYSKICNLANLHLSSLKILNLNDSYDLETIEDFKGLPNLEKLYLQHCVRLVEIDPSIGGLGKLVHIDLINCRSLKILPSTISNLTALEILNISDCSSLKELPDSIGLLTNLRHLNLFECSNLINLPRNIDQLKGLEFLNLDACSNLENLPYHLSVHLTELRAGGTKIKKLPDSIGQLSKLFVLELEGCEWLSILPNSICNLRALKELNLSGCSNLQTLPERIGSIQSLEELDLSGCKKLTNLPDSICNLRVLEHLHLRGCSNLQCLPERIGSIQSLQKLDLDECEKLSNLPDSICNLRALKRLHLSGCSNLQSLPERIESIQSLEELDLNECEKLSNLPDSICNLKVLLKLYVGGCSNQLLLEITKKIRLSRLLRSRKQKQQIHYPVKREKKQ